MAEQMCRFIAHRRSWMMLVERRLLKNDDGQAKWGRWREHFEHEQQAVVATIDGPNSLLTRYNTGVRKV